MTWRAYTLTYQAAAPMLLGDHPLGFIQRTRYYAASWRLWGAITAQLTRACLASAGSAEYQAVGDFVATNLLTSYAYILVNDEPARPHYQNGRLYYGELPAAEFEARFVTSFGQTSVAAESLTAAEGTLHETEVLSAHDHKGSPVLWQFTLYHRDPWEALPTGLEGLEDDAILDAIETFTLGADQKYGLGRLKLVNKCDARDAGEGNWPCPLDWDGKTLYAHTRPDDALPGDQVCGQIEPIVRRLWKQVPDSDGRGWGPGQRREAHLLYAPGSRVDAGGWQPEIGPQGIWQTAGNRN